MKSILFSFVFFFGVFLFASDMDFDYSSGTCNICGATFGHHTYCIKCDHIMCDFLEPWCKFCGGTEASYSGTFDPSSVGGSGGNGGSGNNPGDNPMIVSQSTSGGVTTTVYSDGSISISGADSGSGSGSGSGIYDLKSVPDTTFEPLE